MNIGDNITFDDVYGETRNAKIVGLFSDKYEDVKYENDYLYWSKKTKSYRPFREKDMESIYLEVETYGGKSDFITLDEVIDG